MRAGRRRRLSLILAASSGIVLLLALPAGAGEAAEWMVLPPAGCLPADGGSSVELPVWGPGLDGLTGVLEARCRIGRVARIQAAGPDLVLLEYAPGALGEGQTSGEDACQLARQGGDGLAFSLPLCVHPAGEILVRATPEHLLAGVGQRAVLDIQARDPEGRPWLGQPLELTANIGQASAVQELGEGRYRADYLPPGDPFPQVAVLMVANPRGARLERVAVGRAVVPITARIELPGRTEPGTRMEMRVAGRSFGPVVADRAGNFKLPILVPPGYGTGLASSTDRAGNRRRREVDLFLPEVNQLGLWAFPRRLTADGRARASLLITTVDRHGNPADLAGATLGAGRGRVSAPRRLARGLLEAIYTAPEAAGAEGADRVEVRFPGGKQHSAVELSLLPGPAARATLEAPASLPADGRSTAELRLRVEDARGQPVGGKAVRLEVSAGRVEGLHEERPGLHLARLVAPEAGERWELGVRATVRDPQGQDPARILVAEPGLRAGPGQASLLEAVVVDAAGQPVPGVEVTLEGVRAEASDALGRVRLELPGPPPARPVTLVLSVRGGQLSTQIAWVAGPDDHGRLLGVVRDQVLPVAAPLEAAVRLQLYPAAALVLRLGARPGEAPGEVLVEVHASDAGGAPVQVPALSLAASAGELSAPREAGPGLYRARWRGPEAARAALVLSATDLTSGVGTALEVGPTAGGSP